MLSLGSNIQRHTGFVTRRERVKRQVNKYRYQIGSDYTVSLKVYVKHDVHFIYHSKYMVNKIIFHGGPFCQTVKTYQGAIMTIHILT